MRTTIRAVLALAAVAVLSAGCATGHQDYYSAVREINKDQAEAEARSDLAIASLAKDDPQARGMALMYFALKKNGSGGSKSMPAPPQNEALEWFKALSPALVTLGSKAFDYGLGVVNSNNGVKLESIRWGAMSDVAKTGISAAAKDPLVVEVPVVEVTPPCIVVPGFTKCD